MRNAVCSTGRKPVTCPNTSPRSTKAGDKARLNILKVAERILVKSGHHELSMRKVADSCGISVGNLTYHFRTRELLITELVSHLLNRYLAEFRRLLVKKEAPAGKEIEAFIKWLLTDAQNRKNARLFRELWAISSHYPKAHKGMVIFYNELIRFFVNNISNSYQGLTKHELEKICCLLAVLSEGTGIVYGGCYRLPVKPEKIITLVIEIVTGYMKAQCQLAGQRTERR